MNTASPTPSRAATAREICRRFKLSRPASLLLHEDHTPQHFFAELTKARLWNDAVRFAAEFLTPREAVWWASLCLWQVVRREASPSIEVDTLQRVVQWVRRPNEVQRRRLEPAMHSTDNHPLARSLAVAAFYSGESVSPADQPQVAPPPGQTPRSVASVVALAARLVPPPLHEPCLLHFLKLAGEVSRGEVPWSNGLPVDSQLDSNEAAHV
jgi:hypothetical protein